jgi:TRAP-type C4-dicarboxylate transport system permease small subunit
VLDGFKSLRMPSMTPIAYLYIAIPISGALVALFTIEQMVNGWRKGFPEISVDERRTSL